jgi:hypothetical protein
MRREGAKRQKSRNRTTGDDPYASNRTKVYHTYAFIETRSNGDHVPEHDLSKIVSPTKGRSGILYR